MDITMRSARRSALRCASAILAVILLSISFDSAVPAVLTDEGSETILDTQGSSRRDTMEVLFRDRGVTVEWIDSGYASQPINGRFRGTVDQIFRQLFRESSFIAAYREDSEGRPTLYRLIVFGTGQPGAALDTVATLLAPATPQTAEEKVRALENLRRTGMSEDTLALRRASEPNWAVGREAALQNQLLRTAAASMFPNGNPGQNNSAGYPTYFISPPPQAPEQHIQQAQALTIQMARRNLLALQEALASASPPPAPPR